MKAAIVCLCLSTSTLYAQCDIGDPLYGAWMDAESANTTARNDYLNACREADLAYENWREWIGILDVFIERRDNAELDWIRHRSSCPDCTADNPGCTEGSDLKGYYNLMCLYIEQTYVYEGRDYEEYCRKWQARTEALTAWNDVQLTLAEAHGEYFGHVMGPPPCPDCN